MEASNRMRSLHRPRRRLLRQLGQALPAAAWPHVVRQAFSQSPPPSDEIPPGVGGFRRKHVASNRDAIGPKIICRSGEFQRQRRQVGIGDFPSSHDPRVVLGPGHRTKVDWIEVQWPPPGSQEERCANPPIDRDITIVEGEGKWQ